MSPPPAHPSVTALGGGGEGLALLLAGHAQVPALRQGAQAISRPQLQAAAHQAALGLQNLGLKRGDAIAVWLPNGAAWLQLLLAAAELGVLVVPVSTRYKAPEIAHLVAVSRARLLVFAKRFLDQDNTPVAAALQAAQPALGQVLGLDDPLGLIDWPGIAPAAEITTPGQPNDLLCCFSTSGTTGQPKLAAHDQASIARHAQQVARGLGLGAKDAMLCALPLFGVFGFITALATLAGGGTGVLMPVFDAAGAAVAVAEHHITHAVGADAMFHPMLQIPGADLRPLRRLVMADFAGLSPAVAQQAAARGIQCSGTYGSSEVFSLMALQDWAGPVDQCALPGGMPIDPLTQVRVMDPDTGQPVADGVAGELQIRGPNVLAQYLHNPAATATAITPDGWFRSGDLATLQTTPQGQRFHYLARMGDSLRLRGYLVNPAEIERALMQHPAVAGAQVVGVQQPGVGDQAVGFVVLAGHAVAPDEAALRRHCQQQMAAYKVPLRVVALASFPSLDGPNGVKIQKRVLREMAAALLSPAAAG